MRHSHKPFYIQKGNLYVVPVLHYNMETACCVRAAFKELKPDCVAVELPETLQDTFLRAAARLPDLSVIVAESDHGECNYYMAEPTDGAFEGLRSGLEAGAGTFCIDLDIEGYPPIRDPMPDSYSIYRLGLKTYFNHFCDAISASNSPKNPFDEQRELHMARRLKELSFSFDRILFICGMSHARSILDKFDQTTFPQYKSATRVTVILATPTETAAREVLGEYGWINRHYEEARDNPISDLYVDRQKLIISLYKEAALNYTERNGLDFPRYNFRNLLKFARNYALITGHLMPDLFQTLTSAKGCVDHNYAYEVWELATEYPHRKNIDGLPELELTSEEVWGHSKLIKFHLKKRSPKSRLGSRKFKNLTQYRFSPPSPFSLCSYPPEDVVVERFGNLLRRRGTQILSEQNSRSVPFTTSLEDGVEVKETLRHWFEKKIYVKIQAKPPGHVGAVVVIFDDDAPKKEGEDFEEKYSWCMTWIGEHDQESDMAFYASPIGKNVIGPGISRSEYGGFMMSYPPRRLFDIWSDPEYQQCRSKPEVLLMAAIDYAIQPLVVYVGSKPPRQEMKSYAQRLGKKLLYIPAGQFSKIALQRIRIFHVLEGHHTRNIADEYIS